MYYDNSNVYISKNNRVLFDLNNLKIYKIDIPTLEAFKKLNAAKNPKDIIESSKDKEVYDSLFKDKNKNIKNVVDDEIICAKIHTSNSCNLRCKYCYANHGNYNCKDSIMDIETAKKISNFIDKSFPEIKIITFFGGEALLAVDAIETICKNFEGRDIQYLLQTNGTQLSDRIINLINKYNIKLTVSVDGPKEINDLNRVDVENNGSFDKIYDTVEKLHNTTNSLIAIQATYTRPAHEKYTREELGKYLYDTFKIKNISVVDVYTEDDSLKVPESTIKTPIAEKVDKLFNLILKEDFNFNNEATPMLQTLFSKKSEDYLCTAGLKNITIDHNGNLWPCQLYVNKDKYKMGNINIDDIKNYTNFNEVREFLGGIRKSKIKECSSCIAKYACMRCIGASEIVNKEVEEFFLQCGTSCDTKKEVTEAVLEKLAFYIENDMFEEFNKKLKNTTSRDLLDSAV